MTHVYVLAEHYAYEGGEIVGVFQHRKDAMAEAKLLAEKTGRGDRVGPIDMRHSCRGRIDRGYAIYRGNSPGDWHRAFLVVKMKIR